MQLPPDTVGLLEGLTTTRAMRRFTDEPVPDDALAGMLFAATRAPSMANKQPFRFVVLRDSPRAQEAKQLIGNGVRAAWRLIEERQAAARQDAHDDLARLHGRRVTNPLAETFESVPVVVLACLVGAGADPAAGAGGGVYPACQNLLLAARALGYGGVLTGFHAQAEPELRSLLGIPDDVFVAATIAIGRPEGRHGPVRRHPLRRLVFEDTWQSPAPWAADPPDARFTDDGA